MASLKTLFSSPIKSFGHIPLRLFSSQKTSIGKKRFRLPVEQDAEKLVNYVCGSNIYQNGEDIKLKDDSEYPEWIWKINVHHYPRTSDYDPNTKEFWEFVEIRHLIRLYRLKANRPKPSMAIGKAERDYQERILRSRVKAILPEAIDHGYDPKEIMEEPVNPRIHLKPEIDETIVPYDEIEEPPLFDKLSMYRALTKASNMRIDKIGDAATKPKIKKPKTV